MRECCRYVEEQNKRMHALSVIPGTPYVPSNIAASATISSSPTLDSERMKLVKWSIIQVSMLYLADSYATGQ